MLSTLIQAYQEFSDGNSKSNPTIAIVDLKDLPTIKEFELFRDYFISEGYPSIICSPDEVEFKESTI